MEILYYIAVALISLGIGFYIGLWMTLYTLRKEGKLIEEDN